MTYFLKINYFKNEHKIDNSQNYKTSSKSLGEVFYGTSHHG